MQNKGLALETENKTLKDKSSTLESEQSAEAMLCVAKKMLEDSDAEVARLKGELEAAKGEVRLRGGVQGAYNEAFRQAQTPEESWGERRSWFLKIDAWTAGWMAGRTRRKSAGDVAQYREKSP